MVIFLPLSDLKLFRIHRLSLILLDGWIDHWFNYVLALETTKRTTHLLSVYLQRFQSFPSLYFIYDVLSLSRYIWLLFYQSIFAFYNPDLMLFNYSQHFLSSLNLSLAIPFCHRFLITAQMRLHTLEWSWTGKMWPIQLWWFSLHWFLTRFIQAQNQLFLMWLPLQLTGSSFWTLILLLLCFMARLLLSGEMLDTRISLNMR